MSYFDGKLKLIASSASGVEAITKRELTDMGYEVGGAYYGRIPFEGDFRDLAKVNVTLRTANRIFVELFSFHAETFDELYDGLSLCKFEKLCPRDARIVVNAKSLSSKLFALSSIQSISKKAIVTRLCDRYALPFLNENGATYAFEIFIENDEVKVLLDTSGQGLHKRGYRNFVGEAPIRETLAASIINLSVWNKERALIDPFCGSGTIPIESALIATNTAPGINRAFAFEEFQGINKKIIEEVREEARANVNRDIKLRINAFDINPKAIKIAQKHAQNAGVSEYIHFQTADMRDLSSRYQYGVIITNPPYGERLMKENELRVLYKDFGKVFRSLNEWSAYVITSYPDFERCFGRKADKTRKLYNSELECVLYRYLGARPPRNKD